MSANDTAQLIRRLELLQPLYEFDSKMMAQFPGSTYWQDAMLGSRIERVAIQAELGMRAVSGDETAIAWLQGTETKSQPPAYVVPIYDDPDDIP